MALSVYGSLRLSKSSLTTSRPEISKVTLNNGVDFTFPDRRSVPTATYLEQITALVSRVYSLRSKGLLTTVTERYFAQDLWIQFPDPYQELLGAYSHSITREAYTELLIAWLADRPSWHFEAYNATALVNETEGCAEVFTTGKLIGTYCTNPEFVREVAYLNRFRMYEDGEWLCVGVEMLRGPGYALFS